MQTPLVARFRTQPGDHTFFRAMALVVAAVVLTGFTRTYVSAIVNGTSAVPAIVHLHAVVFTSWLILFIVQTTLVGRDRIGMHRRLGTAGVALAALMVIVGVLTALTVAKLDHRGIPGVEFPDAAGFLLLNLSASTAFGILVGAAWYYRNSPQIHKRLMLIATAGLLGPPGISRLPFVAGNTPAIGAVVLLVLLAGPAYDLVSRKRVHPAYIFGAILAILAGPPIVAPLGATAAWHSIASWLMR